MAQVPIWRDPLRNPLILYPSGICPDFGFIAGSLSGTGTDVLWGSAGADTIVLATGVGEQIGSAAHYTPVAQTSYLQAGFRYHPWLAQPDSATTEMVWIVRARCDSQTSNPVFSARLDYYDSSGVLLASDDTVTLFTCGTTMAADSTHRVMRAQFTPNVHADTARIKMVVGFLSSATAVVYVDWIACGFECNLGDFGPHQLGAYISGETGVKKTYERAMTLADDGTIETTLYNDGLKTLSFKTTTFDETAKVIYDNFHNYCSDKTPFMLMENIQDVSRGLHEHLVLDQSDDGIERIKGTPLYTASIKAREVYFDGRA